MFVIVMGRYNEDEDSLDNISVIGDNVLEFVLSGTKIEKAYVTPISFYPYLPQIQRVVDNIDIDGKAVIFEVKKGKTISHCIFVPVTEG